MNQGKVTLLAFKNTSAELLVKGMDFPTFSVPCDFAEASSAKFYVFILLSQIIKKCDILF